MNVCRGFFLLLLSLMINVNIAHGCDTCGGGIGGGGMYFITSYSGNSFYTKLYLESYRIYSAGPTVDDRFIKSDFGFRYQWNSRLSFTLSLPYQVHQRTSVDVNRSLNAIGDGQVLMLYQLKKKNNTEKSRSFSMLGGLSLRVPTGQFDKYLYQQDLPLAFNIGKGALGAQAVLAAMYSVNDLSFNLQFGHQQYMMSKGIYRFGHESTLQFAINKGFEIKKAKVMLYMNQSASYKASDHYANDNTVPLTEVMKVEGGIGVNVQINKNAFLFNIKQPYLFKNQDLEIKPNTVVQLQYLRFL